MDIDASACVRQAKRSLRLEHDEQRSRVHVRVPRGQLGGALDVRVARRRCCSGSRVPVSRVKASAGERTQTVQFLARPWAA